MSTMPVQQRNRPGTKVADLWNWDPVELSKMDSSFAMQQYISQQLRQYPTKVRRLVKLPPDQDEKLWVYENMRQFLQELNGFIIYHQKVCTAETQPKMEMEIDGETVSFFCSAFKPPQAVSAIDYMINTLAHSESMINSPKSFPNRYEIPTKSMKKLSQIARRCYRIFAFSYYVHNKEFEEYEAKTHLCERFTKFVKLFNLMKKDEFLIPASRWKKEGDGKKKKKQSSSE